MACRVQAQVLEGLQALTQPYHAPTAEQCRAAADCATCHGAAGVPGVTCGNCRLFDTVLRWETKLHMLWAKPKGGGGAVSEAEAFAEYRKTQVAGGRANGEGAAAATGAQRSAAAAGTNSARVHRRDNEHQLLLVALRDLLKSRSADVWCVPCALKLTPSCAT